MRQSLSSSLLLYPSEYELDIDPTVWKGLTASTEALLRPAGKVPAEDGESSDALLLTEKESRLRLEQEHAQLCRPSWKRWWILFVFGLLNFVQCVCWITFSTLHDVSAKYYVNAEIDNETASLLLNWGGIFYVPASFIFTWILAQKGGLRLLCAASCFLAYLLCKLTVFALTPATAWQAMVLASALCLIGSLLRILPTLLGPSCVESVSAVYFLHAAQIFNALAGPAAMSAPSQLSWTWFPESEWTTATALGTASSSIGLVVANLLLPYLSPSASLFPSTLVFELVSSVALMVFAASKTSFPVAPPRPPNMVMLATMSSEDLTCLDADSIAEKGETSQQQKQEEQQEQLLEQQQEEYDEDGDSRGRRCGRKMTWANMVTYDLGLASLGSNRNFVLLSLAYSIQTGFLIIWIGLLYTVLSPLGFTEKQVDTEVCLMSLSGVLGSFAVSFVADNYLRRRHRQILLVLSMGAVLTSLYLVLILPSPFSPAPIFSSSDSLIVVLYLLNGLFNGSAFPIYFEYASEITFPVSQGTSVGLLNLWNNVFSIGWLFIVPGLDPSWLNSIAVATNLAAYFFIFLMRATEKTH